MAEPFHRLVNLHQRPVELHVGGQVYIVPAGGEIEIEAVLLEEPQLAYLVRARVLSILDGRPPADALTSTKQPAAGKPSARTRSKAAGKSSSKESHPLRKRKRP
jgi:hypothetical protein